MTFHICNRELTGWVDKPTVDGTHLSRQRSRLKGSV